MAKVSTPEVCDVSMQDLQNAGLNPFAVELLVESFADPRRASPLPPLTFVWRGVEVSLRAYDPASRPSAPTGE